MFMSRAVFFCHDLYCSVGQWFMKYSCSHGKYCNCLLIPTKRISNAVPLSACLQWAVQIVFFVKVRIHFITVTERSWGEMHTLPLLSCDVCVHQSQVLADTRGILSTTRAQLWPQKTCYVIKQNKRTIWPNKTDLSNYLCWHLKSNLDPVLMLPNSGLV